MLRIITSMSPDILADDMVKKINDCWKKPLVSPVVVFTNAKTEQWFKLHVIKTRGVMMNISMMRMESFMFNMLKTDENQSLLAPDLLRDLIAKKLLSKKNGTRYLDTLKDNDNIRNYLYQTQEPNKINYHHLFDFADDLSKLFIEYEATRDNIDVAIPGDDWQKDLYTAVIGDGIVINNRYYYTCPELAEKNRRKNNQNTVFKQIDLPVFVFGFSGMGQTYRNLLKELSKNTDVYVYLQNPLGKSNEGNNNIFLKHWAQFGKTNRRLFDADEHTENLLAQYNSDSTLGQIQNAIAQDKEYVKQAHIDDTLTITSAASKIKEIETIHSRICQLLKDKNATLKDILVLAPDIEQYKPAITTVFSQVDSTSNQYPVIPFSIVDYCGKNSAILDVLQTLHLILKTRGLSRKSFWTLVKNPVIQHRYKISDDDISGAFLPWIENMRVFRVHAQNERNNDDWENAINRMLVAKLTDKPIIIGHDKIEPFSDFNSEDNDTLTKFIQICDDIKNKWVNKFKDLDILNKNDIDDLQFFLDYLFNLNEFSDSKMKKEAFILQKIHHKLEQVKEISDTFPLEYLLRALIDTVSEIKINTGAVFTRGVTFASMMSNRVLPAKYVFLIGMSSDTWPGTNNEIALDRRKSRPQNGDNDVPGKNKNAFLCQLMATHNELHISFVDKDLQSDNVFYPSSVLDVLIQYTGVKVKSIGIDEKRKWSELYTPRERRNKKIYLQLNAATDNTTQITPPESQTTITECPDRVRIKKFMYFLENPLKCYADCTFGFEEDDITAREMEDIKLGSLNRSKLKKRLIKPILNGKKPSRHDQAYKDILPNEPFDQIEFDDVKIKLEKYIELFQEYNKDISQNSELKIQSNYSVDIPLRCGNKKYDLYGEILMYACTDTDVYLYVMEDSESKAMTHWPEMYALVVDMGYKKCNAHIVYIKERSVNKVKVKQAVAYTVNNITCEYATDRLNEFYKRAFIDEYKKHIPYLDTGIVDKKTHKTKISFDEYKAKFLDTAYNHYYISHIESFNPDTDLGFTRDTFEHEYPVEYFKHITLIAKPDSED